MTGRKYLVFKFADVEVREREFLLIKAGERLPVEPKAFRVLLFLVRNPGRLITKDEILNAVWEGTAVSDNSLTRSIAALRRLLGDDSREPRYIATVPTVGYRFLCPVDISEDASGILAAPDLHITAGTPADRELTKPGDTASFNFLDSIAVLPFENACDEPDMEYLSDGITTSILNKLSQVQSLRVVPRTTVFRYKGTTADAAQVGRELRVRVVLTGRVWQRKNVLHIDVELIDTTHDSQLFGSSYQGEPDDIFRIQVEIAAQVTDKLSLSLNDQEKQQLARRPTKNREAYHLLLKSLYWANKWNPDGIRRGVDYARQAIDIDPVYAEAWTALAYMFLLIGSFGGVRPIEAFPKAKAAAIKALQIDDGEANAHATLAYVQLFYDWNWHGAHEELVRAITLGPNLADCHYVYSLWFLTQGRYGEALAEGERALDIDPLAMRCSFHVGYIHYFARQYVPAIDQLKKALELDPVFAPAHQWCAFAYAQMGMRQQAVAELEKGLELAKDELQGKALWGAIDALTGNLVEARKALEMLRRELQSPNVPYAYHCAVIHALLGERDEAFECLEIACKERFALLAYLAIDPKLENLHSDPRFHQLLLTIGIPTAKPGPTVLGLKADEGAEVLPT